MQTFYVIVAGNGMRGIFLELKSDCYILKMNLCLGLLLETLWGLDLNGIIIEPRTLSYFILRVE